MDAETGPAGDEDRVPRTVLTETVRYSGQSITVRSLESLIDGERTRQNQQVQELQALRSRNTEIQQSVVEELSRLRQIAQAVHAELPKPGLWGSLRSILPGRRKDLLVEHSVEQLLREQYHLSARRVKEAADFADRLAVAERELYDEIDRLNQRIIESSQNKALAAEFLQRLQGFMDQTLAKRRPLSADSVEALTWQADLDRGRRLLTEHATQLQLYHTAVERLSQLKDSTRVLSETIASLRGDITQYVMAASEKLDLVSGQIRAIGAAADATATLLEMKQSLEGLSESLNQTTRFVAETQRYFRENLDTLVGRLEVYDYETRASLEVNLELSRAADDARISRLVTSALRDGSALRPELAGAGLPAPRQLPAPSQRSGPPSGPIRVGGGERPSATSSPPDAPGVRRPPPAGSPPARSPSGKNAAVRPSELSGPGSGDSEP